MSIAHGTISCYSNDSCRCDDCTEAWSDYIRTYRTRIRDNLKHGQADIQHGTTNAYSNYGCRCDDCTRAKRDEARIQAAQKRRKQDEELHQSVRRRIERVLMRETYTDEYLDTVASQLIDLVKGRAGR